MPTPAAAAACAVLMALTALSGVPGCRDQNPASSGDPTSSLPLAAYAEPEPKGCTEAVVRVVITSLPGTTVKVGTAEAVTDAEGGATLDVPYSALGVGQSQLVIEATREGERTAKILEVEPPARPVRVTPRFGDVDRPVWKGQVVVAAPDSEMKRQVPDLELAISANNTLRLAFDACLAKRITAPRGVETRRQTPSGFELELDPVANLLRARSDVELEALELEIEVENADGDVEIVRVLGKVSNAFRLEHLGPWRKVADKPLANAPAYDEAAAQPPRLLIFWGRQPDMGLMRGGSLKETQLVALIEPVDVKTGRCGPYTGDGPSHLPQVRVDSSAMVYVAKTGRKLAEQTFEGLVPACPSRVQGERSIRGEHPTTPVNLWLGNLHSPKAEPAPAEP